MESPSSSITEKGNQKMYVTNVLGTVPIVFYEGGNGIRVRGPK